MAVTKKKQRIIGNPGRRAFGSAPKKKYRRAGAGHSTRSNPGQILGFTLGNPGRKAKAMATKHHSSKKRSGYAVSKYKHNPGHRAHHKTKHYRRNPGALSGIGPLVTNAVFVIVGALGSKLGAQAVLGSNNTGIIGYGGNLAAGGLLWFLAEKVMKNRAASSGILAGTVVQLVLRLINDYTPFGSYVAQLGMGDYQMQSFVTPQVLVDPFNSAAVSIPDGWSPRMIAPPAAAGAPAAAGVGGLYDGGGWAGRGSGLY